MIIPEDILVENKAQLITYNKDDYIFYEGDFPDFYYQIKSGVVKMSSFSTDGQEFTQGIFRNGQSFGEPAIFGRFPFPNNAIALEYSEIFRLAVEFFFEILKKHFDLHRKFNLILAERLRYKSTLLKEISSYSPDHIIMTLLRYIRDNNKDRSKNYFIIPYTRQQIADMTGLRVETVIRTIKKLQKEGKLQIKEHKIILSDLK
jgi:CRP-like cAMP-binding protein